VGAAQRARRAQDLRPEHTPPHRIATATSPSRQPLQDTAASRGPRLDPRHLDGGLEGFSRDVPMRRNGTAARGSGDRRRGTRRCGGDGARGLAGLGSLGRTPRRGWRRPRRLGSPAFLLPVRLRPLPGRPRGEFLATLLGLLGGAQDPPEQRHDDEDDLEDALAFHRYFSLPFSSPAPPRLRRISVSAWMFLRL
jgi:hypothetical protein